MIRAIRFLSLLFIFGLWSDQLQAQVATSTPPFGSFGGGPDVIDLANLNVHLAIPVLHKAGRGTNFRYDLSYDNSVWYPVTSSGITSWQPVLNWGWRGVTEVATGYVSVSELPTTCYSYPHIPSGFREIFQNWTYHDTFGVAHIFPGFSEIESGTCGSIVTGMNAVATDGSGYTLKTSNGGGNVTIISSAGKFLYPPYQLTSGAATATDRNGNQISVDSSGHFYDTLSSTVATLTVSQTTPPTSTTFAYTPPSGTPVPYTMSYKYYTVATNFGIGSIKDYPKTAVYLVDRVTLPDATYYQFTYEATPSAPSSGACTAISGTYATNCVTARIASVILPTGGSISYTYLGGSNGVFADGSASGLQRVLSDGASWTATWLYSRTPGTGAASTTTTTDPANNVTISQFQGIYETQRDIYQGSNSPANLLQSVKTCYNGNTSNCTGTAIALPITQRNIYTVLSGGQQSEHDDKWNTYGAPTETDDYDYGVAPHGALLKKVLASYATLGNITAFRQSVTVQDGGGHTVSQINYNYDETTPTTTSNTPQHVSVPAPWGNLTSTNTYTNATNYLTKSSTFYDTGNLNIATDVNNGVTTYNYLAGTASCGNSFPTSINEAVSGLSTSMTWNCTGGVQLTSVDENSQTTTTTYNDQYFWRPASTTDPTGAVTSYCFGYLASGSCTLSPTQMETTLTFNSNNSTVDHLTTVDGLGRTRLNQTLQAPGSQNFDTVETDYDVIGRASRATLPYSGTRGQTNSTVAATSTTYDAINRPLTVQDGGGGYTYYFYGNAGSQNQDVLVTRSPAPTWDSENTKRRQFEYDALGRLTSVCELTAGTGTWPGGTCAQNSTATGYWTKYGYNPMGNLTGLTQNAQMSGSTQTRTFVYDWMNRVTSETVPEIGASGNGMANYAYDSDSTCGTSNGDLVKTIDSAGNTICSTYDALHRKLTTTYPSGVYSTVTPQKQFVYDSATLNSQTMAYTKARLAEAYTCYSPCSSKLTDIGLSYTVRGETSDVYESTPNSGGFYYHAAQTYWANRGLNQLSGNLGLPTITYGPNGEGRIYSVSASSGQNPVVSSYYNAAGLPTVIYFGSGNGDGDFYSWDPNTNRMTQYQFTVNGTSLTANLGWNANATLQAQNITDSFNSMDTQNCSYGYDDITRLTSANCGSAASQTFVYDPFGNLDKSGSPYTFQPTYSATTNRMTNIAGFTPTYDSNGNVLNDNYHSYTWDADGHAITIDSGQSDAVSLAYDALGRMVEQNRSGALTQITYSPVGHKLALMTGQTLQKAMLPLSGKDLAVYSSSGIQYYGHSDYLGTIRLGTTSSRTLLFDTAYAPFGETYASSGTLDPSYTGQTNDTSSYRQDTAGGLYDFPLREYSSQGRWPSPDPKGRSATCPKDPQTQNRYAYVRNNPMTYTDPTGGVTIPDPGWGGGGGGCDPLDPLCDPCLSDPFLCGYGGGGGGFIGGGNTETPRQFPWPMLPLGFFEGLGNGTQTLKLTRASCEAGSSRNGPEYTLDCWWRSPTQTFAALPTEPCSLHITQIAGGGCVNAQQARDDEGFTVSCSPEVVIDDNCDSSSAKRPFTIRSRGGLVPPQP
jgi:RHS repeat-associated protein